MRDTSNGELGIGLQDIKNGQKTYEEKLKWNRDYLNLRIIAGFYALLGATCLWAWLGNMPVIWRYGLTALALFSVIVNVTIKIYRHNNLNKTRQKQLEEFRKKKRGKTTN